MQQANPGNIVKLKYDPEVGVAWDVKGLLRKKKMPAKEEKIL